MSDRPTERFTSRVDNYVRYRPDYPKAIVTKLQEVICLDPTWVVADIGSGPGNLTRRFLDLGCQVYGVEPNDAMREAGQVLMGDYSGFTSVDGTAEQTTLPDDSVDLVVAGQAFHWFDPLPTRAEFQRILRAPGWVALIWNRRPEGAFQVLDAYSDMLRQYSAEYDKVAVRDESSLEGMNLLFSNSGFQEFTFPHDQQLDAGAFWGRLLSSSYVPLPGQPGHDEIRRRSKDIFETYAEEGVLRFPYQTQMFVGKMLPSS